MMFCLWLTGVPGSGKSTIARELKALLGETGLGVVILELDELRKVLTPEPEYTPEEREWVYRSLVLTAQLLVQHSAKCVIIDATGNRRKFRELARTLIPQFAEVYIQCPADISRSRESGRTGSSVQKDLYGKAEKGELEGGLPGMTAPYEAPESPEVRVDSGHLTPREAALEIMEYVRGRWIQT